MNKSYSYELAHLLEEKYIKYNQLGFIESDPISIPHQFSKKEDIEIAGFLAAVIAWGQRKTVINNANKMMAFMDHSPHDFILNHKPTDLKVTKGFVHRTFNSIDLNFFFTALQNLYKNKGGLENAFAFKNSMEETISTFKQQFFELPHEKRSEKHLADPLKKSTAKRINMYLRWMVRKDNFGVDFGIWNSLKTKDLMLPLDVHTGNIGRQLKLLQRIQNDWKAVEELTANLRKFDKNDPTKYDFALFGIGVNKELV